MAQDLATLIDAIGRQMLLPDDDPYHIAFVPDVTALPWSATRMTIDPPELQHLAQLCEDRQRPIDAARIRRWLGEDPFHVPQAPNFGPFGSCGPS